MDLKVRYHNLIKNVLVKRCMTRLAGRYAGQPVPLAEIIRARSDFRPLIRDSPIHPPYERITGKGSELSVKELSEALRDDSLGVWTLDKQIVELLWSRLIAERPEVIIECGAGVSTVMLAVYASLCSKDGKTVRVFTVEQDPEVKAGVERRLAGLSLDKYVTIWHAPASEKGYAMDLVTIARDLGTLKADMLLIDGPAGPTGARYGTVLHLARFCKPGTTLYLDDSLRDSEIDTLVRWAELPGISINGIYPVGKGLGAGRIVAPQEYSLG